MAADNSAPHVPRIAIVGPTASGKTALATRLARTLGQIELVSVDAMAVYRHMDIGTAKPTAEERDGLSWHLIDIVDPSEEFSVKEFQHVAGTAIRAIEGRQHRPVLVGGTGLYHRAVIDELEIPDRYPDAAAGLYERYLREGLPALYASLEEVDPLAASRIGPNNERRILRALEVIVGSNRPFSSFGPGLETYEQSAYIIIGLELPLDALEVRIADRLSQQISDGFIEEVQQLLREGGALSKTARQALGYREFIDHLEGRSTFADACADIVVRTRQFARRQRSWFKRDPRIRWFDALSGNLFDEVLAVVSQEADQRRSSVGD